MKKAITHLYYLKRINRYILLAILILLIAPLKVQGEIPAEKDVLLLIASYNPDTKRMSDFINDFGREITNKNFPCDILIENMACRGIEDMQVWENKLRTIFSNYDYKKLKGVIFMGQEAWTSFLFSDIELLNIPFWGAFVSENGANLKLEIPVAENLVELAKKRGFAGGFVNVYNVDQNIKLIRSLFPTTKNIAFVSDNTYGGISLKLLMQKEMAKYKDLTLEFIDSRELSLGEAKHKVGDLPLNSALLMGTWRVDKTDRYYMFSAADSLVSKNPGIPVFSISGTSIGGVAVGGYVPVYNCDAQVIAQQVIAYNKGDHNAVQFVYGNSEYRFDAKVMKKMGISDYQLPVKSIVINTTDEKLKLYEKYFLIGAGALLFLSLLVLLMYILFRRNFKLRKTLQQHKEELLDAKEKAEESDRLKSAFLANMSHEIRTPLNAIVGFSHMLVEDDEISDVEKEEFGKIILTNSDLLLALINDILDISRLETGKTTLFYNNEDIDSACRQVLSTTQHLRKPNINYIFEPSHPSYMLYTDVQRLSQILINLVTNANKFTDSGSITLAYTVDVEQKQVQFSVTDTGCGIGVDKQEKVFMRFEKLQEAKQGTGLGLAICKQLAVMFGGDIWVDPDYVNGARFVFSHPIHIPVVVEQVETL